MASNEFVTDSRTSDDCSTTLSSSLASSLASSASSVTVTVDDLCAVSTAPDAPIPAPNQTTSNPQIDNIPAAALEAGDDWEIEDDVGTTTTSLSSSIKAHVWENGRRYNKFREGQYALPNDEGEQNREDVKHVMTLMLFNGHLHFAPIGEHPQNIVEYVTFRFHHHVSEHLLRDCSLGTGTGLWALDSRCRCAFKMSYADVIQWRIAIQVH